MGERTVEFLNSLAFPLADPIDAAGEGLQRFTGTVEALVVPDIDAALDEAPAKTAFGTRSRRSACGTPSCLPY